MFKRTILAFLFLGSLVLAQTAPNAQVLSILTRARTAHGDTALAGLNTIQISSTVNSIAANGQATPLGRSEVSLSYPTNVYRVEFFVNNVRQQITQLTNGTGKNWAAPSGTTNLPASASLTAQFSIFDGPLMLRPGINQWNTAILEGIQTWLGLSGDAVSMTNQGIKILYLFATDGTVQAIKAIAAGGGEFVQTFSDYRVSNGLKLPYMIKFYQAGTLVSSSTVNSITLNPVLAATVFQMP
jgi:hypothetical protein